MIVRCRAAAGLLVFCALPLLAQRSTSSLTGIVRDPDASGVPSADVLAANRATGIEHRTRANSEGVFTFASLPPGNYDVRVEAAGFKRFESRGVVVEAVKTVRLDVQLEVGSVQESATVTADPPLLEQETSGQNSQVGRKLIEGLPFQLSGAMRDINSVIRLVPGVRLHLNNFGYNITGGRQLGSEVLIDGIPNMYRASFNVPYNVRPALDTVAEFRVETAVPSAEFGRTSSGVVVFQTRSGTNQHHGAAEFLLRNNILDARRFNAAQADTTRQGEVSLTWSGPFRLPRYDGRNRTFFLANVTGFRRLNQPQGVVRTLPNEAMRRGDFAPSPQVIYDPASSSQASGRTPFAGNQIPAGRFSRFAAGMLNVIPVPNRPTLEANFIGSQNQIENADVYFLKGLVRGICGLPGIPGSSKGRRCDSRATRVQWITGALHMLRPSFERPANWTRISKVAPPPAPGRRIPAPAGSRGLGGPTEARTGRTGPHQREAVRAGHFPASRFLLGDGSSQRPAAVKGLRGRRGEASP